MNKKFMLVFVIVFLAFTLASCAPVPSSANQQPVIQQQQQPAVQNQVRTPVSNTTIPDISNPDISNLFPVANLVDKDGNTAYSVYEYSNAGMRCIIVVDSFVGAVYESNAAPSISCVTD